MGSSCSCSDDGFHIDPEMNILFDKSFISNFKENQVYLDINNIFPQFQYIEMFSTLFSKQYSLKHEKDAQFHILKTEIQAPAQTGNEILQHWLEKKNSFNYPYLFVVHKIYVEEFLKYIFPYLKITLYFDFPKQTLGEHYKIASKQGFSEKDIFLLLDCVVSALSFLQNKKGYCGNIGLNQIYQVYSPFGTPVFKVIDRYFKPISQPVYSLFYENQHDKDKLRLLSNQMFLSPSQLQQLGSDIKFPKHDIYKSDVFALGMTCLYCIDLKENKDLYDFSNFSINKTLLNDRILGLKKFNCQYQMTQIIRQMLEIEEQKRPDFITLDNSINQLSEQIALKRILQAHPEKDFVLQTENTRSTGLPSREQLKQRLEEQKQKINQQKEQNQKEEEKSKEEQVEEQNIEQVEEVEDIFEINQRGGEYQGILAKSIQKQSEKQEGQPVKKKENVGKPQKVVYANGCYYQGIVFMNQRNGFGIYYDSNNRKLIEGTFLNDYPEGRVRMWNYPEVEAGDSLRHFDLNHKNLVWIEFEGQLKKGIKEGFCILKYQNKDEFHGTFSSDIANGKGVYIFGDSEDKIQGIWQNGKFIEYQ